MQVNHQLVLLCTAKVLLATVFTVSLLAAEARLRGSFGQGRGLIFLDNVNCNGTELQLRNCRNRGIGVHYCSHVEDAGVVCRGEFYESTIHSKLSHIIIPDY